MLHTTIPELAQAAQRPAPAAAQESVGAPAPPAESAQQSTERRHERLRLLARVAAVAVVVGFTAVTIAVCRSLPNPHLKVELHNDTGADLTDLRFAFADGRAVQECKELRERGVVSWDVNGESQGFTVDYRDAQGRAVKRKCDIYFDADHWGTMFVHVKPGGLKVLTEVEVPK